MADNFDLQGWMREQKQGPYTGANGTEKAIFKSSKPKSKTGLNEGLMGMMDLQAINSIMREEDIPSNDENPEDQPGFVHEDTEVVEDTAEVHIYPTSSSNTKATIEFKNKKANITQPTKGDIDEFLQMIAMKAKKMGATYLLIYDDNSDNNDPEIESIEDILSNSMNEEMSEAMGLDISEKWDMIPMEEKEAILDSEDFSEEGLADYAYMGWKMIPDEVKELITDKVMKAKISEPEEDEDEKIAKLAMKQAKKGAKAVKGLNPTKDIHDLLYGDDEDADLY